MTDTQYGDLIAEFQALDAAYRALIDMFDMELLVKAHAWADDYHSVVKRQSADDAKAKREAFVNACDPLWRAFVAKLPPERLYAWEVLWTDEVAEIDLELRLRPDEYAKWADGDEIRLLVRDDHAMAKLLFEEALEDDDTKWPHDDQDQAHRVIGELMEL